MLKQNKWQTWFEAQPKHIQEWMKSQPIYTARDYDKAIVIAFIVGVLFGLLF